MCHLEATTARKRQVPFLRIADGVQLRRKGILGSTRKTMLMAVCLMEHWMMTSELRWDNGEVMMIKAGDWRKMTRWLVKTPQLIGRRKQYRLIMNKTWLVNTLSQTRACTIRQRTAYMTSQSQAYMISQRKAHRTSQRKAQATSQRKACRAREHCREMIWVVVCCRTRRLNLQLLVMRANRYLQQRGVSYVRVVTL